RVIRHANLGHVELPHFALVLRLRAGIFQQRLRVALQWNLEIVRQAGLHRAADLADVVAGPALARDLDFLQTNRARFVYWRRRDHRIERVAHPDTLTNQIQRGASGEVRAYAQAPSLAAHLRLLQIGEVALVGFRAAHVPATLLREHLLREHALQRAELNVDLH